MGRRALQIVPNPGDIIYNNYRKMDVMVSEVYYENRDGYSEGYWIVFNYPAIRISDGKELIYSNCDPWMTDETWGKKNGMTLWYKSSKKNQAFVRKKLKECENAYN